MFPRHLAARGESRVTHQCECSSLERHHRDNAADGDASYDSLAAISSIGRSNYHGMLLTLRKRYSNGRQFDINYTLSQSKDLGSQVERGSAFGSFSTGGNTGFLVNAFDPELNYGVSDFDVRHQIDTNWLADPNDLPETKTTRNAVGGRPSAFADPADALTHFRRLLPGEQSVRNVLRGDGYFTIDTSLSKSFAVGIADHRIRFRWDVFNVTNTPKVDVFTLLNTPDRAGFGRYDGTLATCDAQAGRCMPFALRYEF